MTLADVRGQAGALATLERALAAGRLHHAYRFEGPAGVGKTLTAFGLAQALLCSASPPARLGCGRCSACERAVTLRDGVPLHPDLIIIARGLYSAEQLGGKGDAKTVIAISQIRSLVVGKLGFAPYEGRARVFIVRDADELSTQAANTLLKTLEEPPSKHYFILTTSRPSKLLPTIRSRTLPIRFSPLDDVVLAELPGLAGLDAEKRREVIAESEGSAREALRLADPETRDARKAFIDAVQSAIRAQTLTEGVALSESVDKNRENLRGNVEQLARHFARAARRETLASNRDRAGRLARAHDLAMEAWINLDVGQNANVPLTMLELISNLRRAARQRHASR